MADFNTPYDEGLDYFDDAFERAEQEIIDKGLPLARRPRGVNHEFEERPELPPRLSACGWRELQDLLGQFTAWYSYANEQLPLAMGAHSAADEKKTFAWAKIRKNKTGTVSDKDDETRTDLRYVQVAAEYEHRETVVRLLRHIVDGLKRDIETISRVATIEDNKQNTEGRGVGMENKIRRATTNRATGGDITAMFRKGRKR